MRPKNYGLRKRHGIASFVRSNQPHANHIATLQKLIEWMSAAYLTRFHYMLQDQQLIWLIMSVDMAHRHGWHIVWEWPINARGEPTENSLVANTVFQFKCIDQLVCALKIIQIVLNQIVSTNRLVVSTIWFQFGPAILRLESNQTKSI